MKPVNIQLIRNATLKINYNGKTILVDPMFSPKHQFMSFVEPDKNLNPTLDLPLPIEEITEGVDTLLVTHTHPDHLDPLAVQTLDHNLPTYVQPCDKDVVSGYGFNDIKAVEDVMTFDGIEVTRTTGITVLRKFWNTLEKYPDLYLRHKIIRPFILLGTVCGKM